MRFENIYLESLPLYRFEDEDVEHENGDDFGILPYGEGRGSGSGAGYKYEQGKGSGFGRGDGSGGEFNFNPNTGIGWGGGAEYRAEYHNRERGYTWETEINNRFNADYIHPDGPGNFDERGLGMGSADGGDCKCADDNTFDKGTYYCSIWGDWFQINNGSIENSLCHSLPEKHYDKITKEFVQRVDNLESLRELRNKIGLEKYIALLDTKIIHEETDNQGNRMKLYQYDEMDEKVILLEVVCPSTGRMYHLYPPNQQAKTCTAAKKSTFSNKRLSYRHGDVGLRNILTNPAIPFSET